MVKSQTTGQPMGLLNLVYFSAPVFGSVVLVVVGSCYDHLDRGGPPVEPGAKYFMVGFV